MLGDYEREPTRCRHFGTQSAKGRKALRTEQKGISQWSVCCIARAVGGDRVLLTQLFDELIPVIRFAARAQLRRFGVPMGDVRLEEGDVVTEVTTRLLEHNARELRRWDPQRGKSLKGFIRMLTTRHISSLVYRANRKCSPLLAYDDTSGSASQTSHSRSEASQLLRQVSEHIALCVSARDCKMFSLWSEGWKAHEIGRELGMKENSVTRQLGRIRKRVQQWSHAA